MQKGWTIKAKQQILTFVKPEDYINWIRYT